MEPAKEFIEIISELNKFDLNKYPKIIEECLFDETTTTETLREILKRLGEQRKTKYCYFVVKRDQIVDDVIQEAKEYIVKNFDNVKIFETEVHEIESFASTAIAKGKITFETTTK